eukprot:2096830-Amphidinium_carterae.1
MALVKSASARSYRPSGLRMFNVLLASPKTVAWHVLPKLLKAFSLDGFNWFSERSLFATETNKPQSKLMRML